MFDVRDFGLHLRVDRSDVGHPETDRIGRVVTRRRAAAERTFVKYRHGLERLWRRCSTAE